MQTGAETNNQREGEMETTERVHEFERAGLGKAPFRVVSILHPCGQFRQITHADGSTFQTTWGNTCRFCGHAIMVECTIESSDGTQSIVGSDCVLKTGDAGLKKRLDEDKARVRRERAAEKRRIRAEERMAEVARLKAAFEVRAKELAEEPHPMEWAAVKGLTKRDYVAYLLDLQSWRAAARAMDYPTNGF